MITTELTTNEGVKQPVVKRYKFLRKKVKIIDKKKNIIIITKSFREPFETWNKRKENRQ